MTCSSAASYRRGLLYGWLVVSRHIDSSGFLENKPNTLTCRGAQRVPFEQSEDSKADEKVQKNDN